MTLAPRFAVALCTALVVALPSLARAQSTAHNLIGTVVRNVVTLTWQAPVTPPAPVIGYRVDAGPAPGVTVFSAPLGDVQTLSTPAPDGVYFVRVQALTAQGPLGASNEVRLAVGQAAPPLAPLNLVGAANGLQVSLQWTENPAGPTIAGYVLEAGTAAGQSNVGVVPLPPSTLTLSAPVPAGTYYVRVRAANGAGVSPPSNEVAVTAQNAACVVPGPPGTLTATTTPGSVALSWLPPASGGTPAGYRLLVGSTSGASNLAAAMLGPQTSFSSAAPAGRYFIRVVAVNACGSSAPSNEVVADVTSGVVLPSMRGTWDGVVYNHAGSYGNGRITSFVLRLDAEPPSNGINSIGVWSDNLGCINPRVQAFYNRGTLIISSESLRCNDGDFSMTVTGVNGNVLSGTCRFGCTFQMRKR